MNDNFYYTADGTKIDKKERFAGLTPGRFTNPMSSRSGRELQDYMRKLLPLGSIIYLKALNKRLLVVGRLVFADGEEWDYMGIPWPDGYIDDEHIYPFNKDDIGRVISKGYENYESEEFLEQLR